MPIFTIITPTNLRPLLLKRTIKSVLSQSFQDFEQIIVDDASDAETAQVVAAMGDPRLRYIAHETSRGAAAAYNTGMKNARGQYINFLDDDDEYLPGILEKIRQTFLSATNNPGFVWTGITRVRDLPEGEETIRTQVWPADFDSRESGLMVSTAIGNGFGVSMKKECIDELGYYDETLTVGEDTEYLIKLSKQYNFRTVPEVLVKIHHHGSTQLTHQKYVGIKQACYGRIIARHFDFLSEYFGVINMHNLVYAGLCYELKKKKAGRKAMMRIIKKFPGKRILYADLICYELFGKNYKQWKENKA